MKYLSSFLEHPPEEKLEMRPCEALTKLTKPPDTSPQRPEKSEMSPGDALTKLTKPGMEPTVRRVGRYTVIIFDPTDPYAELL